MRKIVIIVLILACISAVLITIFSNNKNGSNLVISGDTIYEVSFQPQNNYACLNNDLIIATTTKTIAINKNGKLLWELPTICTAPKLQISGNYIMVVDINGQNLYVIKNKKIILEKKLENKIFNAQINENGYLAVSTSADGYVSQVNVFNNFGKEIYYYSVSDSFAIDCLVAPGNNNLAVSLYSADNGKIISGITFIDMARQTIIEKPTYSNLIISNIHYNTDGNLFAIGDTATLYFDKKGKNLWTNKYNSQILNKYIFVKNSYFSLIFNNSVSTATSKTYDFKNKIRNEESLEIYPEKISFNKKNILLMGNRKFAKFNSKGKSANYTTLEKDYSHISITQNGEYFYGISGNNIEIVKIK